jgi:hypothetical protein
VIDRNVSDIPERSGSQNRSVAFIAIPVSFSDPEEPPIRDRKVVARLVRFDPEKPPNSVSLLPSRIEEASPNPFIALKRCQLCIPELDIQSTAKRNARRIASVKAIERRRALFRQRAQQIFDGTTGSGIEGELSNTL